MVNPKDANGKFKIAKEMPRIQFEYKLGEAVNFKEQANGIFFYIDKIQIICFDSGICFLLIKTYIPSIK